MIVRLMRIYTTNCKYYKYSIKSSISKKNKSQINPLSNMSYDEISIVMNTKISDKTQLTFFKAVNNVFVERAMIKFDYKKQQNGLEIEAKAKNQIVNRCINVLTSNIKKLSMDEFFQLAKLFILMYNDHTIKLDPENKEKFKSNVLKAYLQLVFADKNGQHQQKHFQLLKMLLKYNRKQPIINKVIKILSQRVLKNQQDCYQFLSWFEQKQQIIFYKSSLYKIIQRLLHIENKQIIRSQIWVKPFIMKIVFNSTQKNRMYSHLILGRFLLGLKKQLSKNTISLSDQLQYLVQMVDWLYIEAPYLIYVKQYSQSFKIFNLLIEGILKKMETSTDRIKIQIFKNMHSQMYKVKQVIKYHQILNKSYQQLNNQILKIYTFLFKNCFLNNIGCRFDNIYQYLCIDLEINQQIKQQLIKKLCLSIDKFPSQQFKINQEYLRIIQFLTYIYLTTNKLNKQILQQTLKLADQKYQVFSLQQILRIHNCGRLLAITFKNIKDFKKYQQSSFYIQSNSKSFLADYSNNIVKIKIQKVQQKYQIKKNLASQQDSTQKVILKILNSIWHALRLSSNQTQKNNRNSIYINYLYPNYLFIKSLINLQIYQHFCKTIIKQLHRQQKFYFNSLQFEFLIEINRYLIQNLQKDNTNVQKTIQFTFQNFRLAFQLEFVFKIILRCPRYSFLIKFVWYFIKMAKSSQKKGYFRLIRLRSLYLILMKSQKLSLYRQKPNIQVLMMYKLMFNYNILEEQRQKYPVFIVELYLHAIYHQLPLFSLQKDKKQLQNQKIALMKLIVACMEGLVFQFEFLIAFGLVNQNSSNSEIQNKNKIGFMPRSLFKGNFSSKNFIHDQVIIDLLCQSLTLQFLFRRYPHMVQPFFQNLMRVNKILFGHKLVQAANLKQKVKDMLSKQTLIKFGEWIKRCLKQLKDNPIVCQISTKFNIVCQQHKNMVDNYIKQSLSNGNFHILQLLYINNHRGITKQLIQSLKLIEINQVSDYIYDISSCYPQFIQLITNILGVSLIQKSDNQQLQIQLFQFIIQKIFNNSKYNFLQLIRNISPKNQSTLYQLYTLLNILILRLQKYPKLQKNPIKSLITNFQSFIPYIDKKILPYYQSRRKNININHKQISQQVQQIELYDENRPGQYALIAQYLSWYLKQKKIIIHNQIL